MGSSGSAADYAGFNQFGAAYLLFKTNRGSKGRDPLYVDLEEARTLASRGSFLPYVIGRRRVGPVFAWVGDRNVLSTGTRAGGKGGGGGTGGGGSTTYSESAWHLICVGPASKLHRIYVSGKIVFEGPIDNITSPSGTSTVIPDVGTFTIYWGETTQPANAFLGDSTRVDITSRWPLQCYVVWENFALGTQPSWPIVDYDIECEIVSTGLTQTSPEASNSEGPGVNPAHAIWQILFASYPHGLSFDQAKFSIESLEAVGLAVSTPGPQFAPAPINAEFVANFDSADPDTFTLDGDGFIDVWEDAFASKQITPVDPNRRPLYYDGQGTPPAGFATWGISPVNPCPGAYFKADFLTILEGRGSGVIPSSQGYGFIMAVTLFAPDPPLGGPNGALASFFREFGAFDVSPGGAVPISPDLYYVQAGSNQSAGARATYAAGIIRETPAASDRLEFLNAPYTPVTLIIGARFLESGGQTDYSLTVSVVNSGAPITSTSTSLIAALPNSFALGGFFREMLDQRYYMDGVIHQCIVLRNDVQQSDIDLYITWLNQRWSVCGGTPDSRPYAMNAMAQDGKSAGQLLSDISQDGSMGMYWNPTQGQFEFLAMRANSPVTSVPDDYNADDSPPEIFQYLNDPAADKLVFSFVDIEHGYQKQTIVIDDDGVADFATFAKSREINLPTVVDFDSANALASRRSLEEQATRTRVILKLNHEGRIYSPGNVLQVPDLPFLIRVTEVQIGKDSTVQITALPDIYGVEDFFYFPAPTGTGDDYGPIDPVPDSLFSIFELPECLAPTPGTVFAAVPRIRANAQIAFARIYLSSDNISYLEKGDEFNLQTGGTLDGPLPDTDPYLIAQGPTITALGPDIANVVEDLTGSDSLWQTGRQLCLIGDEIFFLQKVTALGGLTYRLDGLIRARHDTERQSHAPGAQVFIFIIDNILILQDPTILVPFATAYAKSQPVASSALDLSLVTPESKVLYGKNVRPPAPVALRRPVVSSLSYQTGDDIALRWDHRTCAVGQGAGNLPAGQVFGNPAVDGVFIVQILDLGLTLVREVNNGLSPDYTYTNADLISDLGAEGDFIVRILIERAGSRSDSLQGTVVLV